MRVRVKFLGLDHLKFGPAVLLVAAEAIFVVVTGCGPGWTLGSCSFPSLKSSWTSLTRQTGQSRLAPNRAEIGLKCNCLMRTNLEALEKVEQGQLGVACLQFFAAREASLRATFTRC